MRPWKIGPFGAACRIPVGATKPARGPAAAQGGRPTKRAVPIMSRLVALWTVVLLASVLYLHAQDSPHRHRDAKSGETCVVCNNRVSGKDACYLAGGQEVVVHAADGCEREFLRHPAKYLAALRPNDILFAVWPRSSMATAWFWFGLYVLAGLLFGGLSAHRALATGRAPLAWFLAGLFFLIVAYGYLLVAKPLAAVALPAGLRKLATTREPLPCPKCGSGNHPSARNCSGCGSELTPMAPSEVAAALRA